MKISKFSLYLVNVLLLVPIFIPVYHSYDDQNYKIYFYCSLASILGFILIIRILKSQDDSINLSIFDIIVLFIVIFVFLHQLLWGKYFDWTIMCRAVSGAIIFYFFRNARDEERRCLFLDVFISMGLIEVLFVILEALKLFSFFPDSYHAVNGTFGNPNVIAIFLTLLIPIYLYRYSKALHYKYLYLIIFVLFLAVIVYCKCRSAIVLAVFIIVVYGVRNYSIHNLRIQILSGLLVAGLISFFTIVNSEKSDSNISRKLIWKVSFEMIRERPITGYGLYAFDKEYNLFQRKYLEKKEVTPEEIYTAGYIRQPYNEFIYCWLTGGIVYFILYMTIFVLAGYHLFKSFKKDGDDVKFAAAVTLTGLLLISWFSYTYYLPVIEFLLFVNLGILASHTRIVKTITYNRAKLLPFWVLVISLNGYYSISRVVSDYKISDLLRDKSINTDRQLTELKKYADSNEENPQFQFNYAVSLFKKNRFIEAIEKLNTAKQFSSYHQVYLLSGKCNELAGNLPEAEKDYLCSIALYPSFFQSKYALFKLYRRLNEVEKAKAIAVKIDKMPIKVESEKVENIKNEIKLFLVKTPTL